jgi:hypothetical protein
MSSNNNRISLRRRLIAPLGLVVAMVGVVTPVAQAAPLRVVAPGAGRLVDGDRLPVSIRVPEGAKRLRVMLDGRDVTERFHAVGRRRVATLSHVPAGSAHLTVTVKVGGRTRYAHSRVFVRGKRDPAMIRLVNANATLLRHAADDGVARLAIRAPRNATVHARLNGRPVRVGAPDARSGTTLLLLNRADGLRRGRNTLTIMAFRRDGRYEVLSRSATIPLTAPMAAAGRDRRTLTGKAVRLDARASRAASAASTVRYSWRVVDRPAGKAPLLRGAAGTRPTLRPRVAGHYTMALTVRERRRDGTTHTSTDLMQTTATAGVAPQGAPISTMHAQGGQTGVYVDMSPQRFVPGPNAGEVGVTGFDPKTLQTDPELNTIVSGDGNVDTKLKAAVAKFQSGWLLVVTGNDCCASSKIVPTSGPFSYVGTYGGDPETFGERGTWNRGLSLPGFDGEPRAKGELTGYLRYQPSAGGTFRYVQGEHTSYSTHASSESTLGPADGATYRIVADNGEAVDVVDAPSTHGPLGTHQPSTELSQQWQFRRAYGAYYRFVNAYSGMCLNLSGSDLVSVLQWECTDRKDPALNELWLVRPGNDGEYFTLEPAMQTPGTTPMIATLRDSRLIVAPRDDDKDETQRFNFGLAPGVYTITDADSGKYVAEPDADGAWGTRLTLADPTGDASQQWRVVDGPAGAFKLVNVASGLCMDVTGASTDPGAPIERYTCDPNAPNQPNELWTANGYENGIVLASKLDGMVLSRQQGALVKRPDADNKGQRFRLNRVSAPAATGGVYSIQAASDSGWGENRTLDMVGGGLQLNPTGTAATQQWQLFDAGDGQVRIFSRAGGCLLPTPAVVNTCQSDDPAWRLQRRTNGTYALSAPAGVLTRKDDGTLAIVQDTNTAAQSWALNGRTAAMEIGDLRASTSLGLGTAGFVVAAVDVEGKAVTGTLTDDGGGSITARPWPAPYVTNGLSSDAEILGRTLQGLANRPGTTVFIQTVGRPKRGAGFNVVIDAIKRLGGDPAHIVAMDGAGDYAMVGCAGCDDATEFDETSRRASDPGLNGSRLQGTLTRSADSTLIASGGGEAPIDATLGELAQRETSPWPFTDSNDSLAALQYIATQLDIQKTCDANLGPVRNAYCVQNVGSSTAWANRGNALDRLDAPSNVDAATWKQVKAQLHVEWNALDAVHATLGSYASVYSFVSNSTTGAKSVASVIQADLARPPAARDITGNVLEIIAKSLQLISQVGPMLASTGPVTASAAADPSGAGTAQPPTPPTPHGEGSHGAIGGSEALLGLMAQIWDLAGENDGAEDDHGDTIETTAADYATELDDELRNVVADLPVVENILVSDPVRLAVAGANARQSWNLPVEQYTELTNDLKAGLTRSLWTKLLPATYQVYRFPLLPSGIALQTMSCNGHKVYKDQPANAVFTRWSGLDGLGAPVGGSTLTLVPNITDDLTSGDDHTVHTPLLDALTGAPVPGLINAGFSMNELIGEMGLDVIDQTVKTSRGNTPIFPCGVGFGVNYYTYDIKSGSWKKG